VTVAERLADALRTLDAVCLGVIFGSTATGAARAGSDVDVGVLLDRDDRDTWVQVEAVLGRAAGRRIDLIDLRRAPPQLRFEIASNGQVLIERRPYAWVDFKAAAMIDWWDWAPTARIIHDASIKRLQERVSGPS
jgi:predicted nucleotidyltransferase